MMRPMLSAAVVVLASLLAYPASGVETAPRNASDAAAHDPANPPIDCPLHNQGVNPGKLRPFAETEKYIQFRAKLVVIEFKEGKLPEGPPESVKIPKAKLVSMIEGAGFVLKADEPALLPYQSLLTFVKTSRSGESARK